MPNINKIMSNQSIYIAIKLPIDNELYIVDFYPIYNRQKVHFITTYLCSRPFLTKNNFWFDYQPCYNMDLSMIIYEWYYNIPAIQWPKDAGFQVGINTQYRYVIIHIQYLSFIINEIYGQQITMTRIRPKYKIGMYQIMTKSFEFEKNHVDFSRRYRLSSIQIFSTRLYSNYEGRSISLYRVRNNQLQSIIKGNLHWPKTFYQLQNLIDIKFNDYLIGGCIYEKRLEYIIRDVICQITIMFWVKQEDEISIEMCWNNDFPRVVERYHRSFLSVDAEIPPQTLFDINPTYPKLSPNEWAIINTNISFTTSKLINNHTNISSLTYSKDDHHQEMIRLIHTHIIFIILFMSGLVLVIGFLILFVIIRSHKNKKYLSTNHIQSKAITVGGETGSSSGWLTRRRFQQYDHEDNGNGESESLTEKHRWASASEGSELSDNEVFHTTDFQNHILKN